MLLAAPTELCCVWPGASWDWQGRGGQAICNLGLGSRHSSSPQLGWSCCQIWFGELGREIAKRDEPNVSLLSRADYYDAELHIHRQSTASQLTVTAAVPLGAGCHLRACQTYLPQLHRRTAASCPATPLTSPWLSTASELRTVL